MSGRLNARVVKTKGRICIPDPRVVKRTKLHKQRCAVEIEEERARKRRHTDERQ